MRRSYMSVTLVLLVLTYLISGWIDIKSQSVGSVSLNSGDAKVYSHENLESTISGLTPSGAKIIYDWKVDKGDGNGFKSIKLLDMPMDGGALAAGKVKNYISNHHGSVSNAVYLPSGGFDGKGAYQFDSSTNTWIYFDTNFPVLRNYTIDVRFKLKSVGTTRRTIIAREKYNAEGIPAEELQFKLEILEDGRLNFAYENSNGSNAVLFSNETLEVDVWYHVIAVANPDNNIQKIYINGALSNSQVTSVIPNVSSNEYVRVGYNVDHAGGIVNKFDGIIDELKIYNIAPTNEQIPKLFLSEDIIVPQETKLAEKWKVCATPNDNISDGAEVCSNELLIVFEDDDIAKYSLRFNSANSNIIKRTPTVNGNRQTWSFSCWYKPVKSTSSQMLLTSNTLEYYDSEIAVNSSMQLYVFSRSGTIGGTNVGYYVSDLKMDNYSKWYHIVVVLDQSNSDSDKKLKMFIDGQEITDFATYSPTSSIEGYHFNRAGVAMNIGYYENKGGAPTGYLNSYISEVNFIDGEVLTPQEFGENVYGKWKPKIYSGVYGENGFYMNFSDQTKPGKDFSGKGNNWTMHGTWDKDGDKYIDQMLDAPTRNFAVINTKDVTSGYNFSDGNLGFYNSGSSVNTVVYSTLGFRQNTYSEMKQVATTTASQSVYGLRNSDNLVNNIKPGYSDDSWGWFTRIGLVSKVHNSVSSDYGTETADGDIVKIAASPTYGMFWIGKDNVWFASGDPENKFNYTYSGLGKKLNFALRGAKERASKNIEMNCGQGGQTGLKDYVWNSQTKTWSEATETQIPDARFAYAPPTSYRPLSENFFLPEPNLTASKNKALKGSTIKLKWNAEYATYIRAFSNDPNNPFTRDIKFNDSIDIILPDAEGEYSYWIEANNSVGDTIRDTTVINTTESYEVDYSLRFISSQLSHLLKTNFGVPTNSSQWTYSAWVKRGDLSSKMILMSVATGTGGTFRIQIESSGKIRLYDGNINSGPLTINNLLTDASKWYHIVISYNDSASDKVKFYVDGILVEDDNVLFPPDGYNNLFASAGYNAIGVLYSTSGVLLNTSTEKTDGYISEIHFIDGQTLTHESFGKNNKGKWLPKKYIGTYGDSGYYLNFSDQTNPGKDFSGKGNNWTIVNYESRKEADGRYIDQMLDAPTRNFAVLDPLTANGNGSQVKLFIGNLEFSGSATINEWRKWKSSHKYNNNNFYSELKIEGLGSAGLTGQRWGCEGRVYTQSGEKFDGSVHTFGYSWSVNDIISMAVNGTDKKVWYSKNNVWQNSGEPETGVNPAFDDLSGDLYLESGDLSATTSSWMSGINNFGQGGQAGLKDYVWDSQTKTWSEATETQIPDARFAYAPPTSYRPLSENFFVPEIELETTTPIVSLGGEIILNVTLSDGDYCIAEGSWSGIKNGSFSDTLSASNIQGKYDYTLRCNNSVGDTVSKTISIAVREHHTILNSLRFDSDNSPYLSFDPAADGNRKKWTWSAWVKRGELGSDQVIVSSRGSLSSEYQMMLKFKSDNRLMLFARKNDGTTSGHPHLTTTNSFTNTADWYHIQIVSDTELAEQDDRYKIFVNGELQGVDWSLYAPQNYESAFSANYNHRIGQEAQVGGQTFDGYMAGIHFIDGEVLMSSFFGELVNGDWIPKHYSGNHGNNGYYLNFSEESNPGKDFRTLPTDFRGWCGVKVINNGNHSSAWLNGAESGLIRCMGHDPATSCPTGYKILSMGTLANNNDSSTDYVKTCVKDEPEESAICGAAITNCGGTYSISLGGQSTGNVTCEGVNPGSSCPAGYNRIQLSMASTNTDGCSDAVTFCAKASDEEQNSSGYYITNSGFNSIYVDGSYPPSDDLLFKGISPGTSCPTGYSQLLISMTSNNSDAISDNFYTCIKNETSNTPNNFTSNSIIAESELLKDSPTQNKAVFNTESNSSVAMSKVNLEASGFSASGKAISSSFLFPLDINDKGFYFEISASNSNGFIGFVRTDITDLTTISHNQDGVIAIMPDGELFVNGASIGTFSGYSSATDIVGVWFKDGELRYAVNNVAANSGDAVATSLGGMWKVLTARNSSSGDVTFLVNFGQGGTTGLTAFDTDDDGIKESKFKYQPPTGYEALKKNSIPEIEFVADKYRAAIGATINLSWNVNAAKSVKAKSNAPGSTFTGDIAASGNSNITLPSKSGIFYYIIEATSYTDVIYRDTVNVRVTDRYEINYSFRFEASKQQFFKRFNNEAGNRQVYTLSFWFKRGKTNIGKQTIFSCNEVNDAMDETNIFIENAANASIRTQYNGSSNKYYQNNDDIDRWQHVVWVTDLTAAGGSRVSVYLDGVKLTEKSGSDTAPSTNTNMNDVDQIHTIGKDSRKDNGYFDGYIAEMIFIDGQALNAEGFGENLEGEWIPKEYSGTYGTNGFYLNFSDQLNPGKDFSPNERDWTVVGYSAERVENGKYIDQMLDSPTRNFAVFNRVSAHNMDVTVGNLSGYANASSDGAGVFSTQKVSDHGAYYEFYRNNENGSLGLAQGTPASVSKYQLVGTDSGDYYTESGSENESNYTPAIDQTKVLGIVVYTNDNKLWFTVNGVKKGEKTLIDGDHYAYLRNTSSSVRANYTVNFGQGGVTGLTNYIRQKDGTWRIAEPGEVPDARFMYKPDSNISPLNDLPPFNVINNRRIIITVIDF